MWSLYRFNSQYSHFLTCGSYTHPTFLFPSLEWYDIPLQLVCSLNLLLWMSPIKKMCCTHIIVLQCRHLISESQYHKYKKQLKRIILCFVLCLQLAIYYHQNRPSWCDEYNLHLVLHPATTSDDVFYYY